MADDAQSIQSLNWRELFPFINLFRAFRVAIHPSKLVLGFALLLLVYCGGRVLDRLWPAAASRPFITKSISTKPIAGAAAGGRFVRQHPYRHAQNATPTNTPKNSLSTTWPKEPDATEDALSGKYRDEGAQSRIVAGSQRSGSTEPMTTCS